MNSLTKLLFPLLLLSSCAQVTTEEEWARLQGLSHTPHSLMWVQSQEDKEIVNVLIDEELQTPLDLESIVRIALLNNSDLQATFEEIGISKSDLVQAGLFTNPKLSALFRFPLLGGSTNVELEGSFLPISDLWLLPLRKRVAEAALEKTLLSVADKVLHTKKDAQQAYSEVFFTQKIYNLGLRYQKLFRDMEKQAKKRKQFGYMIDSDVYMSQVAAREADILVDEYSLKLKHAKSKLSRILGLQGQNMGFSEQDIALPMIPLEIALAIEQAFAHRLDLQMARKKVLEAERNVDLNELMILKDVQAGIAYARESRLVNQLGPAMDLEIPLYDQNQAQISKAGYAWRQAQKKVQSLEEEIRLHLEEHLETIHHLDFKANTLQDEVIPLQKKTTEFVKHWSGLMQINRFVYLQTQKDQMKTHLEFLMTQMDQVMTLFALEYELGN